MLVCNYCGRHFKHEYESCPGCGSGNFKKINDIKEMVIEKAPSDGYHITIDSFEKEKKMHKIIKIILYVFLGTGLISSLLFIIPILIIIGIIIFSVLTTNGIQEAEPLIPMILFLIIFLFIVVGSNGGMIFLFKLLLDNQQERIDKDIVRVNKLAKEGMLIKNMPYELVESGNVIMGKPVYCIKVDFKFENGTVIPLTSNPKFDGVDRDKDNSADLLIDKNDYSNYYIDFEIY